MGWAVKHAYKFLLFLKGEYGLYFLCVAITLAIYATLYLFSIRTSAQRSLRGLMHYLFPSEVFRQARIDFLAFIAGSLAWSPLASKIVGFIAFETTALHLLNVLFGAHVLKATNSWLVLLMQFLVFYFTFNFALYWAHRAMHQNRLLWSVHRSHHSAEALTFLTSWRVHPFESLGLSLWTTLWSGCAAAALNYYTGIATHPLFPAVFFFWLIISDVIDKLQHSHVRTSLGPLNYIIPSGEMHQIHHSAELKHRDKNFGNASSVFDWMFGTIYIPRPDENIRLGLSEQEVGAQNPHKRAIDIYTEPFAYAWRVLEGAAKWR